MEDRFIIEKHYGSDSSAKIYLATDIETNSVVRIRRIQSSNHSNDLQKGIAYLDVLKKKYSDIGSSSFLEIIAHGLDEDGIWIASPHKDTQTLLSTYPTPCSLDEFETAACQLLEAMDKAHSNHLYHGAISPSTVEFSHHGSASIYQFTDFGFHPLYQLIKTPSFINRLPAEAVLTPPELFKAGELPDIASDLFMLGQLLYTMLAGGHPWAGLRAQEVLVKHNEMRLPPLHEIRPHDITPELSSWLAQLVHPSASHRPKTASIAMSSMPSSFSNATQPSTKSLEKKSNIIKLVSSFTVSSLAFFGLVSLINQFMAPQPGMASTDKHLMNQATQSSLKSSPVRHDSSKATYLVGAEKEKDTEVLMRIASLTLQQHPYQTLSQTREISSSPQASITPTQELKPNTPALQPTQESSSAPVDEEQATTLSEHSLANEEPELAVNTAPIPEITETLETISSGLEDHNDALITQDLEETKLVDEITEPGPSQESTENSVPKETTSEGTQPAEFMTILLDFQPPNQFAHLKQIPDSYQPLTGSGISIQYAKVGTRLADGNWNLFQLEGKSSQALSLSFDKAVQIDKLDVSNYFPSAAQVAVIASSDSEGTQVLNTFLIDVPERPNGNAGEGLIYTPVTELADLGRQVKHIKVLSKSNSGQANAQVDNLTLTVPARVLITDPKVNEEGHYFGEMTVTQSCIYDSQGANNIEEFTKLDDFRRGHNFHTTNRAADEAWMVVDLHEEKMLESIRILKRKSFPARGNDLKLYLSDDGKTWHYHTSSSPEKADEAEEWFAVNSLTRYIKFVKSTSGCFNLEHILFKLKPKFHYLDASNTP